MRFRDIHRNIKIRIGVMFLFGMVQATTMPFMAVYFARNFGEGITGTLLAIGVVASMFSGAIGGYFADRIGRRKLMILSESIFLISYLTMAMANSPWYHSAVVTFLTYMVNNMCWGIYGPVDEAMLLDVSDADSRPLIYSIFYWMFNFTMAIGASIGAVLFEAHRFLLFGSMAVVVCTSLLITIFFIQETYTPPAHVKAAHQRERKNVLKSIIANYAVVLKDATFIRYVVAGMLVMSLEFQLQNYIGIRLAKDIPAKNISLFHHISFHFDGLRMLGFLQTENTIIVVLCAALATKIIKRYTDRQVLLVSILMFVIGYSIITVSSVPMILFAAMVVATLGEVARVPVAQTYLGDIAPEHARTSYVAVNGMTFSGAQMLASLGVILGAYIPSWGMGLIAAVFGVVGLSLYLSIVPAVHARRKAEITSVSAS